MAKENIVEYQFDKLTAEKQREIAIKGGKASGKVRQEKATMRKVLEMMLEEKNSKGVSYKELSTLGLIKGAINGNANNYRAILEVLGELKSRENVETPIVKIEVVDNSDMENVLYESND